MPFPAILVQAVIDRLGPRTAIALDRPTAESLCAAAMDFLVVAAIAAMDFEELGNPRSAIAFLIACAATTACEPLPAPFSPRAKPRRRLQKQLSLS